jgi:hypothetical protein
MAICPRENANKAHTSIKQAMNVQNIQRNHTASRKDKEKKEGRKEGRKERENK